MKLSRTVDSIEAEALIFYARLGEEKRVGKQ